MISSTVMPGSWAMIRPPWVVQLHATPRTIYKPPPQGASPPTLPELPKSTRWPWHVTTVIPIGGGFGVLVDDQGRVACFNCAQLSLVARAIEPSQWTPVLTQFQRQLFEQGMPLEQVLAKIAWITAGRMRNWGYPTDFSISSLGDVDGLIERHSKDGKPKPGGWLDPGPVGAPLNALVTFLGCYVGEVLKREHGGNWHSENERIPDCFDTLRLQFANGAEVDPAARVFQRFKNGARHSIMALGPEAAVLSRQAPWQQIYGAGLSANADRLLPCIRQGVSGAAEGGAWSQPLVAVHTIQNVLAGLHTRVAPQEAQARSDYTLQIVLGIDLPETILYAPSALVAESGRSGEEWLARALDNLAKRTPPAWWKPVHERDDSGLRTSTMLDDYDIFRALLLDRLFPGMAETGWFVAPVGWNELYFMPATELTHDRFIVPFKKLAEGVLASAGHPISQEIYWVYHNNWYWYPVVRKGERWYVVPPQEFSRVFGVLDQIEEAE